MLKQTLSLKQLQAIYKHYKKQLYSATPDGQIQLRQKLRKLEAEIAECQGSFSSASGKKRSKVKNFLPQPRQ